MRNKDNFNWILAYTKKWSAWTLSSISAISYELSSRNFLFWICFVIKLLDFEFCEFFSNPLSYLCHPHYVAFLETARWVVVVAHGGALSGLRSALLLQRAVGDILGSSPGRGAARPGLRKARWLVNVFLGRRSSLGTVLDAGVIAAGGGGMLKLRRGGDEGWRRSSGLY